MLWCKSYQLAFLTYVTVWMRWESFGGFPVVMCNHSKEANICVLSHLYVQYFPLHSLLFSWYHTFLPVQDYICQRRIKRWCWYSCYFNLYQFLKHRFWKISVIGPGPWTNGTNGPSWAGPFSASYLMMDTDPVSETLC